MSEKKFHSKSNIDLNSSNSGEEQIVIVRSSLEKFFFSRFMLIIPSVYLFRALLQYFNLKEFPPALLDFVKIPSEIALIRECEGW